MDMQRAKGFVELSKVVDGDGKVIPFDRAERYGWIRRGQVPEGWTLTPGAYPFGANLFVDSGRQALAYVWGGRSPMANYACQNFGIGTGTSPATVLDVALTSPVAFDGGSTYLKALDAVSYTSPFEARAEFTIAAGQANGYLLTEFGLFSGNGILLAHIVNAGINKTSDWAPALTWRLRF
jgi:hypothetical protein